MLAAMRSTISTMSFSGVYRFAGEAELAAALAAVQALVDGEDDEFPTLLDDGQLARRGLALRVHVDTACPADLYDAYELIVETLAAHANDGLVEGRLEGRDGVERYAARASRQTGAA